jgi:hypothetical protein
MQLARHFTPAEILTRPGGLGRRGRVASDSAGGARTTVGEPLPESVENSLVAE